MPLCPFILRVDQDRRHCARQHGQQVTLVRDVVLDAAAGLVQDDQHVEVAIRAGIAPGLRAEDEDVFEEARVVPGEGLAVFVEPCLFGRRQVQDGVGLSGCGSSLV